MGSIGVGVQADCGNPRPDDSRVLPGRQMGGQSYPARKQIVLGFQSRVSDPGEDRFSGRLRDFELNRSLRFLLHDDCTRSDSIAMCDVANAQLNEIAAAQFAVDRQIKQRKFALSIAQLKTNPNCPNVFEFKRCFLTDQLSLILRIAVPRFNGWCQHLETPAVWKGV
jgi:hypothetical protein